MYKYFLGLKYLLSRWINLLCVTGVLVATWALIVIVSVFQGFIEETLQQQRAGAPDLSLLGARHDASYRDVAGILEQDPGVEATAPRLAWFGLLFGEGNMDRIVYTREEEMQRLNNFFRVIGVDYEKEKGVSELQHWLERGAEFGGGVLGAKDPKAPFDVPAELLSEKFRGSLYQELPGMLISTRRSFGVRRYYTGQAVTLTTGRRLPSGIQPSQMDFAISAGFRSDLHELDATTVLVDIDKLRNIFGVSEFDEDPIDIFNEISIRVRKGQDPAAVAARLNQRLDEAKIQGAVFTWQERKARYLAAVEHEQGMMKFIVIVALVIAMFLVFAATSMMVTEKTRDIGVLSALGATKRGILVVFMFAGLTVSVIGAGLGILFAWLSLNELNSFNDWLYETYRLELFPRALYGAREIPYVLETSWVLQVAALTITSALLFSSLPALRASRLDPVQALRYE